MLNNSNSTNEFLNKRVLITGATSGIGYACAMYFLNNGAKVVLCGRDTETLNKIGKKFPKQAIAVELDLCEDMQINDLKTSVIENFGGLDIILNCAGAIFDGDIEKTFPQDYDYTIDINLRAIFIIMINLKSYLSQNSSIINVSCLYGSRPQSGLASYCISKSGVEMLTKLAAAEFSADLIRVNAVTSCPVDTNFQRYCGCSDTEFDGFKKRVSENIPLGRLATPDEVARAILFLASNRSSKITGQILKVDGGRSLTTSGWVPWKGAVNMNARFEPDGMQPMLKIKDIYSKYTGGDRVEKFYPNKEEDIEKFINESNWATRLAEAHDKVEGTNYKKIAKNDNYLRDKFIK